MPRRRRAAENAERGTRQRIGVNDTRAGQVARFVAATAAIAPASWPRETLGRGLAGHRPVALHLKQGPRLSNNWGPPHPLHRVVP